MNEAHITSKQSIIEIHEKGMKYSTKETPMKGTKHALQVKQYAIMKQ